MGGAKRARREARAAAEASRYEAGLLREQTLLVQRRADEQAKKAQRMLMRSLRAKGGGFFESDTLTQDTLGGGGLLG